MNQDPDRSPHPAQDSPRKSPQGKNPSGNTSSAQGEAQRPVPRLPHERDESADEQASQSPGARRIGELAHHDVAHGVADTSRSVETDQTYHRLREGRPNAGKD